jgi:hypothetical protein
VIDENFARKYFPGQDPIGRPIHMAIFNMDPEIVGVVGHVKHWGLDLEADRHPLQEQIYSPSLQISDAAVVRPASVRGSAALGRLAPRDGGRSPRGHREIEQPKRDV